MRCALNNLNADLGPAAPQLCVSVLWPMKARSGAAILTAFMELETTLPTLVTTSQLLTTGVDVPTCKNIVIARVINSMTEFKQIIGRGTRVRDDYGKLFFNILDYTGSATRLFADPDFDGEPALLTEEEMNALGETIGEPEVITEEDEGQVIVGELSLEPPPEDGGEQPRHKYYVNGDHVEIAAHIVHELDADGKQLRVVTLTDYTAEKVRSMYTTAAELRSKWSNAQERATIITSLEQHGISLEELMEASKQPEADPFDVLCNVAFSAPLRTRRERAEHLRRDRKDFFERYSEPARQVLNDILQKYIEYGTAEFEDPGYSQAAAHLATWHRARNRWSVQRLGESAGCGD